MAVQRQLRALYVCYLSLEDPLVHTQVIAYLVGLVEGGHRIHLLTFEAGRRNRSRRRYWRRELAQRGISLHVLRYHKRPSLPATVFDALLGAAVSTLLLWRYRLDTLHARSHVPAAMALVARRLCWPRRPALIFDIRGLLGEEYVDTGNWTRDGVPYRLTKWVEGLAIRRADGIVVLTERVRTLLFGDEPDDRVHVIPCCADLETIAARAGERDHVRARLGLSKATVLIYVGKFTGWYMESETADFFAQACPEVPGLHFLILTQSGAEAIEAELARHAIESSDYTLTYVPPEEIGAHLGAADLAISFIRSAPSKASSSPTKIGEYLAAGLPVISSAGVGDLDSVLGSDVGVLVSEHTPEAHQAALERALAMKADPSTAERCRAVAEREFSLERVGIPRYRELYEGVGRRVATKREEA